MSFRAPKLAEVTRPTPLGDADVLYFLHIPRTGGTTLHELLEAWFPPEGVLKAGSRGEVPNRLDEIGPEGRAGLRFFSGHYDTNVTRLLGRTPRFITMLREPIARTMSHYEIIKRMPNHKLHDEVTVGGMTFLDYLHDPRGGIADRDRQVRQIAGVMDAAPDAPYPPPEGADLLELACERLEDFAFFGIHELYSESIDLLAHTFGREVPAEIPKRNATTSRNHAGELLPDELEAARALNRLDLDLYRFAHWCFGPRWSAFEEACRIA